MKSQLTCVLLLLGALLFGFSSIAFGQTTLITKKSSWLYDDSNTAFGSTWTTDSFDDSGWTTANGIFGYGDLNGTTPDETLTSGYITYYFRKTINITDPHFTSMDINILCDDGFALYINGQFVTKDNLPSSWSHSTVAPNTISGSDEVDYDTYTVTTTDFNLVPGDNVIAVEIHNRSTGSSDLGFDLELIATAGTDNNYTLENGPYIQMATPTGLNIRYRTSTSHNARVFYGTNSTDLNKIADQSSNTTEHEVILSGLTPNTKYYYAIADSAGELIQKTNSNYFYTPPTVGSEEFTRVWVLGDCGRATSEQEDTRDAYYNYVGNDYTDAVILLGDNAYNTGTDSEFENKFFAYYDDKILRQTPLWPAPGNHDYGSASPSRSTNCAYYDLFTLPTAGEAGGVSSGTEQYYSFDHANIHFLSLDSYGENGGDRMYDTSGAQAQWVKSDLAATSQLWRVAYWHHPPFTMGSHNSDNESELIQIREKFMYIMDQYDVDLILCGHSHNYERSKLIDAYYGNESSFNESTHVLNTSSGRYNGTTNSCPYIKTEDNHEGYVYAVAGSASRKNSVQSAYPHNAMYFSESSNAGSLVIETQGKRMDIKFINENGVLQDSFTIMKNVNRSVTSNVTNNDSLILSASWPGTYNWSRNAETSSSIKIDSATKVYYVSDNQGCLRDTFVINGAEQVPVAVNDNVSVNKGDSVTVIVLSNDIDPGGSGLTVAIITQPDSGVAYLIGSTIKYVPDTSFSGLDTIWYSACGTSLCDTAMILLTVSSTSNCNRWVAFNDLRNHSSTSASYVTEFTYNNQSGSMKDSSDGSTLNSRISGSYVSSLDAFTNGANCNSGTDAYKWFNGIADVSGVYQMGSSAIDHVVTFEGLDPNGEYEVVLTTNRNGGSSYSNRWTKVTIQSATSYTNESSTGTVSYGQGAISFSTGNNTSNGYVARWSNITPGSDSSFSIKSEWLDTLSGTKGYSMTLCRLEQICGSSSSGGSNATSASDEQVCWLISDADNMAYKVKLNSNTVLASTSTAADPEASTLNLAGDTLWYIHQDDLYYIDLTAGTLDDILFNDDFDAVGLDGTKHGNNKDWTDYDAMTIDMQNRIWVGTKSSEGAMFVLNPKTGEPIPDFFGSGQDYIGVGLPPGGQFDCMAIDPLDGFVYANLNDGGGSTGDVLYRISPTTGDTTRIAKFAITDLEGMGFTGDGRLIATTGQNAVNTAHNNQLWEIDINSGEIVSIYATPGGDVEACDCEIGANVSLNEVSGYVFVDTNQDTIKAGSEVGFSNIEVSIYRDINSNGKYDSPTDTLFAVDTTNSNGYYYKRIPYSSGTDSFIIVVNTSDLPANHTLSTDNIEIAVFTSGQTKDENNNFGAYSTINQISGYVFEDVDQDTFYTNAGGPEVTLIYKKDLWKYLDTDTRPNNWETSSFDDSSWPSDSAVFGYGTITGATVKTTVDYGSNANTKYITTYFRKKITLSNPNYSSLKMNLMCDDAAAIYVNGNEVKRYNLPTGTLSHSTEATSIIAGSDEGDYTTYSVSAQSLVDGDNYIAVEIHQRDGTSSDLAFDLEVIGINTSSDNATSGIDVTLYDDVNDNQLYDNATDTLVATSTTDLSGYYSFNTTYTSGIDNFIILVDTTDGNLANNMTTDAIETAQFSTGGNHDQSNNFGWYEPTSTLDTQWCWMISDAENKVYEMNLDGGAQNRTFSSTAVDPEAATLNLAGDTLWYIHQDDLYFIDLSVSPLSSTLMKSDFDANGGSGLNGAKHGDGLDDTDYDAMTIDLENNIWVGTKDATKGAMFVLNPATGEPILDYFGTGIDYIGVGLPTGGAFDCMAIDPLTGDVYANLNDVGGSTGDVLYRINKSTGDTTRIAKFSITDIEGLGFTRDGRLIATTGKDASNTFFNDKVWEIDIQSAEISYLFATPGQDVEACDCEIGENVSLNEVSGFIFEDENQDTVLGNSEPDVTNVLVNIYRDVNGNGRIDNGIDTVFGVDTANSNGYYYKRLVYNGGTDSFLIATDTGTVPGFFKYTTDNLEGAVFTSGGNIDSSNNFGVFDTSNRISGFVFLDGDSDTIYSVPSGDNPTENNDVRLYRDINANQKFDSGTDTLIATETTDALGYFFFRVYYGTGTDNFVIVVDESDGNLSGNMTTDIIETASFSSGGNHDQNNNFGYNPSPTTCSGWTVFNNLRATGTNASYVTTIGYNATGSLKDSATNLAVNTVSMTGSNVNGLDPQGSGGNFNSGTDAYNWFNGICDITAGFELDAADWDNIVTFNGLDPNSTYDIVLTYNRNNNTYTNRWTNITIQGADSYINTSSSGVVTHGSSSVGINTGYNTVNGHVARWSSISPGADSSFSVKSEWYDTLSGSKGYAMTVFRLQKECPADNEISGFVFEDVNQDTVYQSTGSENPTSGVDINLYRDINGNSKYDSATDTLVESKTTNSSGYYTFSVPYISGTDNFVIIVDSTDRDLGGNMTTDIVETASFSSGGNLDENNNFGYYLAPAYSTGCAGWTAFNNIRGSGTNAAYVTAIGYAASGSLKDSALNSNIPLVSMVGSSTGGLDPEGSGHVLVSGTDAYNWFNGVISPSEGFALTASNDTNTVTFNGLDPNSTYEIVLTHNRSNSAYDERWTLVKIEGADNYNDASSTGVVRYGNNPWVSMCTGYNDAGRVIRWTGISPGSDSTFKVHSVMKDTTVGGDANTKGYAMSIFRIQKECPADNIITGYVFEDVNADTVYQNGSGDNSQLGIDVKLYRDVNSNGKLNNPTDTLVDSETTNSVGYFKFRVPYGGGIDRFLIMADTTDGNLSGNMTTDNIELATFTSGGNTDDNNNSGFYIDPVPVTWLRFDGTWRGNDALLEWSTASEDNSQDFVVQRMLESGKFEELDVVEASGHSRQITQYTYLDQGARKLKAKNFFYRLKQRDFDGAFAYSTIILLKNDSEFGTIQAAPVPFSNTINVQLFDISANTIDLTLTTITGAQVARRVFYRSRESTISLNDLGHLSSGVYLLKVNYDGKERVIKLIK